MDSKMETIDASCIGIEVEVGATEQEVVQVEEMLHAKAKAKGKQKKAKEEKQTDGATRWVWTDKMVDQLIKIILECKHDAEEEGNDFEGDLVSLYSNIRIKMAEKFEECHFGAVKVTYKPTEGLSKHQISGYRKLISDTEALRKRGYIRVKDMVKKLRRGYKKSIDEGKKSGSGRYVELHWHKLREIWGGSPAVTAIEEGITTFELSSIDVDKTQSDEENLEIGGENDNEASTSIVEDELFHTDPADCELRRTNRKRRFDENTSIPPPLSDNKRLNMKKKLSAHQRDMMFYNLAEREAKERTKIHECMLQSFKQTTQQLQR